jgi:hypothetical protein
VRKGIWFFYLIHELLPNCTTIDILVPLAGDFNIAARAAMKLPIIVF